eukprot:6180072-Prymnesium_polylepis.1
MDDPCELCPRRERALLQASVPLMRAGTASALAQLAEQRALENGWVLPRRATPEQAAAARLIQAR